MFIVGYVTEDEAVALISQGWQLEPAEAYEGLLGRTGSKALLTTGAVPGADAVVVVIDQSIPEALTRLDEQSSTRLLRLDEYTHKKTQLEVELSLLKTRCAHLWADGSSMIAPSTHGQGETYCPNCGNKWD